MTAARVRIDLLGPVAVTVDGAPLSVDTRKAVALLAWLALTRRPAARETLAGLLWPEADGADAKGALRRTLSVLRTGLHGVGLEVDRASVGLRGSEVDVDAWRFAAALTAVRGHDHPSDGSPCAGCLAQLETAAALDRGGLMAGFTLRDAEPFDEWQTAETEAYRRDLSSVLERLARGHLAAGAWEPATAAARRWLVLDPLHEPAHRTLMEALARAGEPAAAIAQYRACVRVLDRELGVAPLPETTELADAIRAGVVRSTGRSSVATADSRGRPSHPLEAPLVGRDEELAQLGHALEQVGRGGRLIAVTGEPGIGKTRLLAAAASMVQQRGGVVLAARAWAGETSIAFSVVAELVRAASRMADAPGWLAAMDPEQRRDLARLVPLPGTATPGPDPAGRSGASGADPFGRIRLFGAVLTLLDQATSSGSGPGALVIDDLHLADPASIELIGYLARRLPDHPLTLLVAWRAGDPDAAAAEPALDAAQSLGLATRLRLGRLTPEATTRLAHLLDPDHPRLSAAIAESEGLPLFLVEAMASPATETVPGGVQVLLRARVAAVSEVARQVLAAAAVIGRSFDPALVRVTSGRSEEETVAALDELIGRGLVDETTDAEGDDLRIAFSHGRLRDAVYDELSLVRRRLLHGRAADALREAAGRSDPVAAWSRIAHHEALAGRAAAAAAAHARAGDGARSVFANAVAREHLEAALALGHPDAVALHDALGEVLMLLGDYEGARMHLETAAALAGPAEQAALEHRLGVLHVRRGDPMRADGHLIAAISAGPPAGLRSRILADRAAIADRAGDPAEAAAQAAMALALALDAGDPVGVVRARGLMGILARHAGDLEEARRGLETALSELSAVESAAVGPGSAPEAWSVRVALENSLALTLTEAGDHDAAIVHATAALTRCERLGDRHLQAALENNLADLLHATGRPDEAMTHLTRAVTLFAEIGGRPGELEPEIWKLVEW